MMLTPQRKRPLKPYVVIGTAMVLAALVGSALVTAGIGWRGGRSTPEPSAQPRVSSGAGLAAPSAGTTPPPAGQRPALAFTIVLASAGDVRIVPSYADETRQVAYFGTGDPGLLDVEAKLTLYEPGAYDGSDHGSDQKILVNGRSGFFGIHETTVTASGAHQLPTLSWQYRDRAWAVLTAARRAATLPRLEQLAGFVMAGPIYQMQVPCRFTHLPTALRPVSIEGVPLTDRRHLAWSALRFGDTDAGDPSIGILGGAAVRVELQSGAHAVDLAGNPEQTTVGGYPALWHRPNGQTPGTLEVQLPEGVATVRVDPTHAKAYPREELERIVLGMRCAPGVADLAAWYDVTAALAP